MQEGVRYNAVAHQEGTESEMKQGNDPPYPCIHSREHIKNPTGFSENPERPDPHGNAG